ncbi:MAG: D-xylose transporter XylE [Bacteroidales bacterium]|nr:D-xylose transporter XylE [Bacteroidales bacterium]MBN2819983.1 D-xylose transporter XylE [Bacteroidales bacterium]
MKTSNSGIYLALLTLTATLGGLLFGYDTAVISGAVGSLKSFFIVPLTNDAEAAAAVISQFKIIGVVSFIFIWGLIVSFIKRLFITIGKTVIYSLISGGLIYLLVNYLFLRHGQVLNESLINVIHGFNVSSALIGCIIGGSIGGFVSQNLGRKNGLILAAVLFLISALGSAIPDKINFLGIEVLGSFMVYRVIGGVGVGLASMLSPMYIAEIAPANIRGKLVSFNQFAIIFGMLVVYFVNYFIAKGQAPDWLDTIGWRWMFASEMIPASLFLIFLFFVPETPRYLVLMNKEENALGVLNKIVGTEKAKKVLADIKGSLVEKRAPWMSFGGLIIVIGIFLSVFQQFVGINVVLYYAPAIFETLGAAKDVQLFQTIIVGIINLSFTVVAILTVDKFGRKPLQIIGAVGMAISMTGLGFAFFLGLPGIAALIFMLLYVASFAVSWGPVTWVLLAEIFPNSIRGAMGIAVAAQWLSNLLVSTTFPMMNDSTFLTEKFHNGFAYWIYAVMGILAALFMWKLVPETKGKTLEDLEKIWKK